MDNQLPPGLPPLPEVPRRFNSVTGFRDGTAYFEVLDGVTFIVSDKGRRIKSIDYPLAELLRLVSLGIYQEIPATPAPSGEGKAKQPNDGGLFHSFCDIQGDVHACISVRMWLAGQAMAGLIFHNSYGSVSDENIAKGALAHADALIAAEGKEEL